MTQSEKSSLEAELDALSQAYVRLRAKINLLPVSDLLIGPENVAWVGGKRQEAMPAQENENASF